MGVGVTPSLLPPDPPVHIVAPREHVFVHAITSECVMLTCEVDREDAPVHWFKDGQEVEESDFVLLESEGPHRRLVLPSAQPSVGGEFQCVAGDERAYFTVTITGGAPGRPRDGAAVPSSRLDSRHTPGPPFPTAPSRSHPTLSPQPMVCTLRFSHCRKCIVISALVIATWQREAHLLYSPEGPPRGAVG